MASVNVLVRARPLSQSEISSGSEIILRMENQKTYLNYKENNTIDNTGAVGQTKESLSQKQFSFDKSYWSVDKSDGHYADQLQIFNEYGRNVVQSAIDGYNACVFAYGQTGSGKTYTMMGSEKNLGMIPRICEDLFKQLAEMRAGNITSRIEVSFMEIYNEQVHDLLQIKSKSSTSGLRSGLQSLKIREHPKEGPFVQDLSIHPVNDYPSVEALIEQGNNVRMTAATKMNAASSRSHSIFTLKLTQAKFCGNIPSETASKVHLVDLAGSERVAKSGVTGIRLKEGGNINRSLTTLGLVISTLADNSNAQKNSRKVARKFAFVPYRDSMLTWLLKDSIGGNSRTIMVATVSPAHIHYGETLSTLRYASRARKIINKPVINEDPNVKTIRELRTEINKLRKLLKNHKFEVVDEAKSQQVEAKLKEHVEKADQLTKHWLNKITEAQKIFKEKCMTLSQMGQQTVLTSEKPHLVGLEVDPLSTDIVIYHLEEGSTVIRSCDLSDEQGIALEGSGIEQEHCVLTVSCGRVVLHPINGPTYVNEELLQRDFELRQGDVLQFGHFLKFRFHNPMEAAELREKRRSGHFSPMSSSQRMSPAVMMHYRSLDSGLSSPDDLGTGIFDSSKHVLNSTATSQDALNVNMSLPNELQQPYGDPIVLDVPRKEPYGNDTEKCDGSDTQKRRSNTIDMEIYVHQPVIRKLSLDNSEMIHNRKQFLKSASTSDVPRSINHLVANSNQSGQSSQFLTKPNRMYMSADAVVLGTNNAVNGLRSKSDSLLPTSRKITTSDTLLPTFRKMTTSDTLLPTSRKMTTSDSDLSLSTDDLSFNVMLQSQIKNSSSSSSLSSRDGHDFYGTKHKAQSMWEISPRKYEQDDGEMLSVLLRHESLSVLHHRSFNGEEMVVNTDQLSSGSALVKEARDAEVVMRNRRDQLKTLIQEYRVAEIGRVQVEKENIRRAQENEQVFLNQQSDLKNLMKQQKLELHKAKLETKKFQKFVACQKQEQRANVEREFNHVMKLKQQHLPYLEWSEHELRKRKFKLKLKIEDYWKRVDLYETMIMELKIEHNKVKCENDEKIQEKIKQFEQQQTTEVNALRQKIQESEDIMERLTLRLDREKEQEAKTSRAFETLQSEYNAKIQDAENFCADVETQEESTLSECRSEIARVEEHIKEEQEKLYKYTIYNMHEGDETAACSDDDDHQDSYSVDCQLSEEQQRTILDELTTQKNELSVEYDKKVEKYSVMKKNADNAFANLREEYLVTMEAQKETCNKSRNCVYGVGKDLERENELFKNLKNELKAFERPRSFIDYCPEETEEDIIANEQQIEQLILSRDKVRNVMETSLEEEFAALKIGSSKHNEEQCDGEQESTAMDDTLSLIFHAGDSSAFTESILKKHAQCNTKEKSLTEIKNELRQLMKYQMGLHQEVAENFLEQKSLFEEVRSQERKDIHEIIQALITEYSGDDRLLSRIYNESERIIASQSKLETLEKQMYEKITRNHDLQYKIDELQEKLAQDCTEILNDGQLDDEKIGHTEELNLIQEEKRKCDQMISVLQKKLFEEREAYLEILKSKEDYDIIGPEFRDERHSLLQTEGNRSAADLLREVFMVGNLVDVISKSSSPYNLSHKGWKYIGEEKNVQIFKKRSEKSNFISVAGRGIIKASPKVVWETIRNPLSRLIYDKFVKQMNIIEHFNDHLKVVYFQHQMRLFIMKQKKDCCCIHNERIENDQYIASYKSIQHPDCPEKKGYSRLEIQPSGWVLEPYSKDGNYWCVAWYILQVDASKGYTSPLFVDSFVRKLPLSIAALRDYLVLS